MYARVIDTHTHIGRYGAWDCDRDELVRLMDAYGVDVAVVGQMESNALGAAGFEDTLAMIRGYESRLRPMLWINPARDGDAACAARVLEKWRGHIACMKAHPETSRVPLGDPRYLPYLRLCREYGLTLAVHTEPGRFSSVDSLAAMAERHPEVAFVAVHMEMRGDHSHAMALIARHANLYGDTTFLPVPDVKRALEVCGAEKVLFGSDAPVYGGRYDSALKEMRALMTPREQAMVFCRNAERLFNIGN